MSVNDPIHWTGDLDDDCHAVWRGLGLHAECMGCADEDCEDPDECTPDHGELWWWSVSDSAGKAGSTQLANCWGAGTMDKPEDETGMLESGDAARAAAEAAAIRVAAATPCRRILRNQHLTTAASEWDQAIDRLREFLARHSEQENELVRRLVTAPDQVRFRAYGLDVPGLAGFPAPYRPFEIIEDALCMVGYQILDDGEPGVAYYRQDGSGCQEICGPEHDGARPYFHRNLDALRRAYPDAAALTVELGLEVLAVHEADEAEFREWAAEHEPDDDSLAEEDETRRLLHGLLKELEE